MVTLNSSMATIGRENLTPGALYELVARGNKDTFFFTKELDKGTSPFTNLYRSTEPQLGEWRTQTSTNSVDFGKMVEFQLEVFGDVLTDMYILVDMPSWLPSLPVVVGGTTYPPEEANRQYHIVSTDGNSYGWVRGIGYLLFERIQILQDSILLQDISGDSLLALDQTSGTNNQYYLRAAGSGMHNGSARSIAGNATPGRLRVRVPFPCLQGLYDGGLPLCALKEQNFRIRFYLRRPETLWESAVPTSVAPWNTTFNVPGVITDVGKEGRYALKPPQLLLETRQLYLADDQIDELRKTHLTCPFIRYYDETFTIGELDYAAFDRGGVSIIQRRMEGRHPMERLLLNFRKKEWLQDGQLWRIGGDEFYNNVGFYVAGQEREYPWPSPVLRTIQGLVKDDRFMASRGQSELRWSIPEGKGPSGREPTGTVNFTTASRPTLQIDLKDVAPGPDGQRTTLLQVCGESWGIYEVKDGRGRLVYLD